MFRQVTFGHRGRARSRMGPEDCSTGSSKKLPGSGTGRNSTRSSALIGAVASRIWAQDEELNPLAVRVPNSAQPL